MGVQDVKRRAGVQGRRTARRGLEKANEPMHEASSIDDRVVTNPDPEEHEPPRPSAKPIVSINGEDVDHPSKRDNRKDRAA